MDIQKLLEQAIQQREMWAQKELQAHDQVQWWRGRFETLQQLAAEAEKPAGDQQAAESAALEGSVREE
jgi:hypothetical protein